jgi:predicted metallo-beta-lactamase superfamily hydrolase
MKARIEIKAVRLFETKMVINKYSLAETAYCDQRTAQRILKKLHENNFIVIADWHRHYRHWIPIYKRKRKNVNDKPKPDSLTRSEIYKRYMMDVEHQINRLMRDRARRTLRRIGI